MCIRDRYSTIDHALTDSHISCSLLIVPHRMNSGSCVCQHHRRAFALESALFCAEQGTWSGQYGSVRKNCHASSGGTIHCLAENAGRAVSYTHLTLPTSD